MDVIYRHTNYCFGSNSCPEVKHIFFLNTKGIEFYFTQSYYNYLWTKIVLISKAFFRISGPDMDLLQI